MNKVLIFHPEEMPAPAKTAFARAMLRLTKAYQAQAGATERHEAWLREYRARMHEGGIPQETARGAETTIQA